MDNSSLTDEDVEKTEEDEDNLEKWKLEFQNGLVSNFNETKSNMISSRKYKIHTFFPKIIFYFFSRISNFYILIASIICYGNPSYSPFEEKWFYLSLWLTFFVLFSIKEMFVDFLREKNDSVINNQTTSVIDPETGEIKDKLKWKDVKLGNVLYLKDGETAPADIVLLDSERIKEKQAFCVIDSSLVNGFNGLSLKKAPCLTQVLPPNYMKSNMKEYRKILTGQIEYEGPSPQHDYYNGYIKLRKDPKIEQLTFENFIPRGSIIKHTEWLVGLVVYTGADTKIMVKSRFDKKRNPFFHKLTQIFFLVTLIIILVLSSLTEIMLVSNQTSSYIKSTERNFITYFILFAVLFPIDLQFYYDLMVIIIKKRLMRNKEMCNSGEYLSILDPQPLGNLGLVDYIFLDKTGTLTTGALELDMAYYNNKLYKMNISVINKKLKKDPQYKNLNKTNVNSEYFQYITEIDNIHSELSLDSMDNTRLSLNLKNFDSQHEANCQKLIHGLITYTGATYIDDNSKLTSLKNKLAPNDTDGHKKEKPEENPSQDPTENIKSEENFLNDLLSDNRSYYKLFETLTICQNVTIFHASNKSTNYETKTKDEEVIMNFCRIFGFNFIDSHRSDHMDKYSCRILGKEMEYDISAVNDFIYSREKFSIMVKDVYSGKNILLCKGSESVLRSKLAMSEAESENFDKTIKYFQKNGLIPIVFAQRLIDTHDSYTYLKKYNNLKSSLINQSDQLEQLVEEIEKDLKLVVVLGLKEEIQEGVMESIQTFKDTDLNVWLLTGDNRQSALSAATQLKIINTNSEALAITETKHEELFIVIRKYLNLVKNSIAPADMFKRKGTEQDKNVKGKKKKVLSKKLDGMFLVLNGASLEILLADQYLKPHFIYLLSFIKYFVGYNLNSFQKGLLVKIVKRKFTNQPTVLAVGDGYNDSIMMQSADISFEIVHKGENNKYNSIVNAGDVQVSNFNQIIRFMYHEGRKISLQSANLIFFFFYKSFFIGTQFFLFLWYTGYIATPFYNGYYLVIYYTIVSLPGVIIYSILFTSDYSGLVISYPALYKDTLVLKRKLPKKIFLKCLILAALQGIVVFYVGVYSIGIGANFDGYSFDYLTVSTGMFIITLLVHELRLISFMAKASKQIAWILVFFPVSILLILIHSLSDEKYINIKQGLATMGEAINILSFIFNFIVCGLLIIFIDKFINRRLDRSLIEKALLLSKTNTLTNEDCCKLSDENMKLSSLVKRIFNKPEIIDSIVQEMICPSDLDANEMKLDKYSLRILDPSMERRYARQRRKKVVIFSRIYMLILLLLFGLYTFFDYLIRREAIFALLQLSAFLVGVVFWIGMFTSKFEQFYYVVIVVCMVGAIIVKMIIDWIRIDHNIVLSGILAAHISTCSSNLNLNVLYVTLANAFHFLSLLIRLCVIFKGQNTITSTNNASISGSEISITFVTLAVTLIILLAVIVSICLYLNYRLEKQKRNEFLAEMKINMDSTKCQDILSILVPTFVKEVLDAGKKSMKEKYENVTIIFCDIYDFDKLIACENKRVVHVLDSLFRAFDSLCQTHGVQKIETVGKTYMAAAGLKVTEGGIPESILKLEKTRRVLNLALDMMDYCQKITYGKGEKVLLKIGIHVSPCIAGVIGYHKPQFSLMGDTVNTTSRVCSTGDSGKLILSEEAWRAVNKSFTQDLKFVKKFVQAKGKGDLVTYVTEKRDLASQSNKFKMQIGNLINNAKKTAAPNTAAGRRKSELMVNTANDKVEGDGKIKNLVSFFNVKPEGVNVEESPKKKTKIAGDKNNKSEFNQLVENGDEEKKDDSNAEEDEEEDSVFGVRLLRPNILLSFDKSQLKLEHAFKEDIISKYKREARLMFLVLFVATVIQTLLMISVRDYIDNYLIVLLLRGVYNFCFVASYLMVNSNPASFIGRLVIYFVYIGSIMVLGLQIFLVTVTELYVGLILELLMIYLIHSYVPLFSFIDCLVLSLAIVAVFISVILGRSIVNLEYYICFFAFVLFTLIKVYTQRRTHIKNFNNLKMDDARRAEQENLVSHLLPYHAFEKLKNVSITNKLELTDEFDDVTILFADIAGFTKYSSSVRPEEVVNMLSKLFTEFDKMCVKHKVYKVYTIGDCYVVLGFINSAQRNHVREAINVVKMGLSMIEIIEVVKKQIDFHDLNMRIGIHTGSIIGGIIGTDVVRYDIYGQDVLIANKMESNGVEGNIMVSESTKKMLEKDKFLGFSFEKIKEVECKNHAPIPGYLIHLDKTE